MKGLLEAVGFEVLGEKLRNVCFEDVSEPVLTFALFDIRSGTPRD